jgi:hypothetical protein
MINKNLISESQADYVIGILGLIREVRTPGNVTDDDRLVSFPLFCVLAALSERIVSLESTVARCINKMDLSALKMKLQKARDMFLVNDTDHKVCLSIPF